MHILVTIAYPIFAHVTSTLIYERSLGILKTYPPAKNEVSRLRFSKMRTQTVHTHTHPDKNTQSHCGWYQQRKWWSALL